MSQILDATLVIAALRMALGHRRPAKTLILHSDRGAQFASAAYRQVLAQHGLVPSMSRKANCYDNAFIESFFSSLKYELVYHHRFATRAQARTAIFHYIEIFYNRTRLHSSLDYQSPINFESKLNQITLNQLSVQSGQSQTDPKDSLQATNETFKVVSVSKRCGRGWRHRARERSARSSDLPLQPSASRSQLRPTHWLNFHRQVSARQSQLRRKDRL